MRTQTIGESAENRLDPITNAKAYIDQHHDNLAGAIDRVLMLILTEPDLLQSEENVFSCSILHQFRRVLFPAPDLRI